MIARSLLIALVCLIAGGPTGAGEPGLDFVVWRQGEAIGRHQVRFLRQGGQLQVTSRGEIELKAALFTLYALSHRSTEAWQGDRLVSLISRTVEDGELLEVSVRPAPAGDPGEPVDCRKADGRRLAPASFWSEHLLLRACMIDPIDGARAALQISHRGNARLGPLVTRHYRLAGDDQRELWFDARGLLMKMRLRARDGSTVEMRRTPGVKVARRPD